MLPVLLLLVKLSHVELTISGQMHCTTTTA